MNELDPHNILLNFEKASTGETILNFGANDQPSEPIQFHGVIEGECRLNHVSEINAVFDLNFLLGVSLHSEFIHEHSYAIEKHCDVIETKPKVINRLFEIYALTAGSVENSVALIYEHAQVIGINLDVVFEKARSVNHDSLVPFQENHKLFNLCHFNFDNTFKHQTGLILDWQERIRIRQNDSFKYDVALNLSDEFNFPFDRALPARISKPIIWHKAKAIYYRKSKIPPWPKPKQPEYQGSTILNFIEPIGDIDPFNIILNFGSSKVTPELYSKKWWYIVNDISVSRIDNGEKILVYEGSYNTDRSRWCWSYSLTVPASEISKLEPVDNQPVVLKIMVNGNEHHMLLENRSRSQKFASVTYQLSGRSITALLDAPYAATRSFTQENERTSVQLVQAELERINRSIELKWQLIDDLGWILPTDSLSYSNLTPIAAIKLICEAGGGFIYSAKAGQSIAIRPRYKKTFWNVLDVQDYDVLIPESIVTDLSTDYELYPDYNGITLTNDRTGLTAQIKRRDTAGNVLYETANNPLFETASMQGYAISQLAKAGMVETHSLAMPLTPEIGECAPGDVLGFNGEWWGIIESVNVSFTYAVVSQTLKVERVIQHV
ncbi:hypothetical protein [Acinetobacter stercoris]|uniref:Uncharacterized protein n=1 Tax=Acinetobacter stercoris TaxID=2126983 RepID=A0A2U3N295_9GAMM|nr:hypothetical protein [Acinetobacter stercoris]SPL71735.1 hypothetical protein KPC_2913 [Acinetobacter stercoris]